MAKYLINYGTGAGNFEFEGTLDEVKTEADKGIAYTQTDCNILLDGEVVAMRRWWGVEVEDEYKTDDIIDFGKFGYYEKWVEY